MRRRLLVTVALLAAPSLALAQRGRRSSGDGDKAEMKNSESAGNKGPQLRARDVEDFSAIKLMIDKRKDLNLTDAQVDALKKNEDAAKKQNEPLFNTVDSLVHEMRPPLNADDAFRVKVKLAGDELQEKLEAIRANYDAGVKDVAAGFNADQQAKWKELTAKNSEEAEKRVRERMGGGFGGGRRG